MKEEMIFLFGFFLIEGSVLLLFILRYKKLKREHAKKSSYNILYSITLMILFIGLGMYTIHIFKLGLIGFIGIFVIIVVFSIVSSFILLLPRLRK